MELQAGALQIVGAKQSLQSNLSYAGPAQQPHQVFEDWKLIGMPVVATLEEGIR